MSFPTNIHYFLPNVLRLGEHFDRCLWPWIFKRPEAGGEGLGEFWNSILCHLQNFRVEHQIKAPEKSNQVANKPDSILVSVSSCVHSFPQILCSVNTHHSQTLWEKAGVTCKWITIEGETWWLYFEWSAWNSLSGLLFAPYFLDLLRIIEMARALACEFAKYIGISCQVIVQS